MFNHKTPFTMASSNDTGHPKNVANFEALINFCTGYGVTYNPSKASIKIAALNTLLASAQVSLAAYKTAETAFNNATNAREIIFKPLKPLCTRVVSALAATDAARQTVDDANTANFKIQGRRASGKPEAKQAKEGEAGEEPNRNSVSQQSFDNQVEHFTKLIQTLTAEPLYKPNEVDLQVASLNTLLTSMKDKNKAAGTSITNESNARIARNKILYAETTGIHAVSLAVKKYVKSVFGASSPQFRQVSGIKIIKLK
jgi:hypothetical protein